jgi:HlyD family secretion protein
MTRALLKFLIAIVFVALAAGFVRYTTSRTSARDAWLRAPRGVVERADFKLGVTLAGEIKGANQTLIRCDLENIWDPIQGGGRGGIMVVSLAPDGSMVKKGDVLCQFDKSGYEDMAHRQRIGVERANVELRQAELDVESAQVALRAYRDGESRQITEALRGRIALQVADLERARERLAWCERMRRIRYVSASELTNAGHTVLSTAEGLKQAEGALRVHTEHTAPRTVRELGTLIESAEERREFATVQKENQDARLRKIERLIQACSVRAPHDGLVVYADAMFGPEWRLREGIQVYQGQPMFYLPEMTKLVAAVSVNESVAARVRVGMPARIRLEAFPNRVFTGKVQQIDQLPIMNWRVGLDVLHFEARVAIDQVPRGVLPDMSAEVFVITGQRKGALVVPVEALTVEEGREYCYVARGQRVERRPVRLQPGDGDRLAVVQGLEEGEEVILTPKQYAEDLRDATPSISREQSLSGREQTGEPAIRSS